MFSSICIIIPAIFYSVPIENFNQLPQLYSPATFEQSITTQVEKIDEHTQTMHWQYLLMIIYVSGVILSKFRIARGLLKFNTGSI